ncbi:MAG: RNase P subunit [Nitrosopumilaceae archaeon]|nr:RNase P subunit [Nitrosopumilaceae archaeon]NIT99918.1 RNase P subunit [Nitrosopumilaceae archaeon]NIU86271.1 RNase P subunit [Nitrosopumilaceae archaeon]NIV65026.1 RNase P subunit [Nitrosopumilaceae archaeon]NIX60521.1 RNase P subunit [Nitrosopumilaceae archaeon]
MKPSIKQIALERMEILVKNAITLSKQNPKLSRRYAELAKKISTRYKIRMPYELKICFCKKCKSFIAPGIDSKIRIGTNTAKSIKITCRHCGHVYRKIIAQ